MRRCVFGLVLVAGVLFPATSASAHAQFLGSDPKPGATLDAAPSSMTIDFSEPPISGDDLVVEDGCGNDMVTKADVDEKALVAELADGQPGKWKVSVRVVSAVDGHPTEKSFSFTVEGEADCTKETGAPPPREKDDSSSNVPLLTGLVVVTLLIVGVAFELRRRLP